MSDRRIYPDDVPEVETLLEELESANAAWRDVTAEATRYRKALEQIAKLEWQPDPGDAFGVLQEIARAALENST